MRTPKEIWVYPGLLFLLAKKLVGYALLCKTVDKMESAMRPILFSLLFFSTYLLAQSSLEVRSYDGSGNNLKHPKAGAAGEAQTRLGRARYKSDGVTPDYPNAPNPRSVSNSIGAARGGEFGLFDPRHLSYMSIFWGQFLAHDIERTPMSLDPKEDMSIVLPEDDTLPGDKIKLGRSVYVQGTGTSSDNPRAPINMQSNFIDGSQVYGSSGEEATALRTLKGGMLKTSEGNLVLKIGGRYVSGDPRVHENPALLALHTIFIREHNRFAKIIAQKYPKWNDEQLYQAARKIVGAEIQSVTVNEYVKSFGIQIPPYHGYDPTIDPSLPLEVSTALLRFGHSQIDEDEFIAPKKGNPYSIPLVQFMFDPAALKPEEFEGVLRGACRQGAQRIDSAVTDAIRNSVVINEPMGRGRFDLFAIDIQRGRDHGLPDYNSTRKLFGLSPIKSFDQMGSDKNEQKNLQILYKSVEDVDLFVGMLAEDLLPNESVGALIDAMFKFQVHRWREGDRFWYENDPAFAKNGALAQIGFTSKWISGRKLSDIIIDNTQVTKNETCDNIFIVDKRYIKNLPYDESSRPGISGKNKTGHN